MSLLPHYMPSLSTFFAAMRRIIILLLMLEQLICQLLLLLSSMMCEPWTVEKVAETLDFGMYNLLRVTREILHVGLL